jgi:hypothetical protein
MNLQELSYLEVYNHVYEEIKAKEKAQIKIRRWWCFVNTTVSNISIVRSFQSHSFTYNLKSFMYLYDKKLSINGIETGKELFITFDSFRLIKLYLLKLILRAIHVFKLQITETTGYISDGTYFQTFE